MKSSWLKLSLCHVGWTGLWLGSGVGSCCLCESRDRNGRMTLSESECTVLSGSTFSALGPPVAEKQAGGEQKVWQRSDGSVMRGGHC